jgi:dTDP-4-dehydrorhamnose 3,5-epimerase
MTVWEQVILNIVMAEAQRKTALDEARCAAQTVTAEWEYVTPVPIQGVQVKEIRNVVIRSGVLTECYRPEWFEDPFEAGHVVYMSLMAGGMSSWHCHRHQRDVIVPISGQLRLGLYDDRVGSPSHGCFKLLHLCIARPMAVRVPPLVWHAIKNPTTEAAAYIVVNDEPYRYENPDDWVLPSASNAIPYSLD